jgi:hypothetical protein
LTIAASQVPDNDKCIQREKLSPYEPVFGNLTEANFDYYNQGVCGPRSDRPSVWYEVRGRDAFVTVKVCTNNDVITDFGVFTECNSQLCLGAPVQTTEPSNCEDGESTDFRWFGENNVQYFVHVRSDVADGVGSNFTIVYEDESLDGPIDGDDQGTDDTDNATPGSPVSPSGGGSAGSFVTPGWSILALASSGLALFL